MGIEKNDIYIDFLVKHQTEKQIELENLLEKYKVQPVGDGFTDLILTMDLLESFILDLTTHGFIVQTIAWWCHCTDGNQQNFGCPHGMGGPKSLYYDGWFSEMGYYQDVPETDLQNIRTPFQVDEIASVNNRMLQLAKQDLVQNKISLDCLVPGIWLYIPEDWYRKRYLVDYR